ncbi:hypothetical protein [Pseudobacillus wudalianchiensis]|uniref:Uncharacterized protein n=1 Tax=Pseudobacillus wudalianchiensis TaxID=1743143 RepID=A0A1B9AMS8_9BACI|nr:hypothetical protein [Bacillus wudalianchiensis]OCA85217.1 hypothetical protein A8F95_11115 [Bacillus wudalianchiensis]
MVDIRDHGGIFGGQKKFNGKEREFDLNVVTTDVITVLPSMGTIGTNNLGKRYVTGTYGNGSSGVTLPIYDIQTGTVKNSNTAFSRPDHFTVFIDNNGKEWGVAASPDWTRFYDLETGMEHALFGVSAYGSYTKQAQSDKTKNKNELGHFVAFSTGSSRCMVIDVVNKTLVKSPTVISGLGTVADFVIVPNHGIITIGAPNNNATPPILTIHKIDTDAMAIKISATLTLPDKTSTQNVNSYRIINSTLDDQGYVVIAVVGYSYDKVYLFVWDPATMTVVRSAVFNAPNTYLAAVMDSKKVYKIMYTSGQVIYVRKSDLKYIGIGSESPKSAAGSETWQYAAETLVWYNGEHRLTGGVGNCILSRKSAFTI